MTTAPTITGHQRDILRNAACLDRSHRVPGRRTPGYMIKPNHADWPDCERLTALGLLSRKTYEHLPYVVYYCTEAGKEQATARSSI